MSLNPSYSWVNKWLQHSFQTQPSIIPPLFPGSFSHSAPCKHWDLMRAICKNCLNRLVDKTKFCNYSLLAKGVISSSAETTARNGVSKRLKIETVRIRTSVVSLRTGCLEPDLLHITYGRLVYSLFYCI